MRLIKRDISISWPWPLVTLGMAKRALVLHTVCSKHLARETGKRSAILECPAVATYHTAGVIRGEQMETLTFAAMLSQQCNCLPLLPICLSHSPFLSKATNPSVCGSKGVIIIINLKSKRIVSVLSSVNTCWHLTPQNVCYSLCQLVCFY